MENSNYSRRERKKIESKARILKAARALFQKQGYDNTSIEQISERADVSKSTFFNYFPTKESLLDGIAVDETDEIRELIEKDLVGVKSPSKKIRIALKHFAIDSTSFLRVTRKVIWATVFKDEEYPLPVMEIEKTLLVLIKEAQVLGEIQEDLNPEDVAKGFIGMYLAAFFKWIKDDENADISETEHEFDLFLDMFFKGIAGPNY